MLNKEKWTIEGCMVVLISVVFLCQWADFSFHVVQRWKLLHPWLRTDVFLFDLCSLLLVITLLSEKCRLSTLGVAYALFFITSELVLQMLFTPAFLAAH